MAPRLFYRIAAVLILLHALGHSSGYPWSDPAWGVDLHAMQSTHFTLFGSSRTYWDFYVGFGLFSSVFLIFAALLAWQLGSLPAQTLPLLRGTAWALVLCFAGSTFLSWRYFFIIPFALSAAATVCLAAAAWLSRAPSKDPA